MKSDRISPTTPTRSLDDSHKPDLILSGRDLSGFRDGLSVGEVLSGRVLEVLDDSTSLVRFRGYNLVTQSESSLPRGAQVHAEVTGLGEQITMRLLQPGGGLDRAASMLEELGIPVTRGALAMIGLMEQAGVPINAQTLQHVFSRLASLPPTQQAAELLVLTQALNTPTSDATLETLRVLTEPQPSFGQRVATLESQLQTVVSQLPQGGSPTLTALGTVVSQLALRPDADNVLAQLRWFMHHAGMNYEASLLNGAAADSSFKGLLIGGRSELVALLAAGAANGAMLETVRANIEGVLHQLDASQMLARIPSINLPHLYLQIPYWVDPMMRAPLTLEVRGRKEDPTADKMDEDNTEIEFSVKTKKWGRVHLRFVIHDGRIRASIEAETAEAKERIDSKVRAFVGRLEEVGYSIQQMTTLVARALGEPEPVIPPIHFGDFHLDMEV